VIQFIDNMGGISLTLDEASARYLGVSSGPARLDGLRALKYMSPGRDSRVKSIQRQNQVMMSIFTALSEGKITTTAVLAGTVLANARTDMDAAYLNAVFDLYRNRSGWNVDFTDLAASQR
jgi:anionic cell wall polymer biosynthesis LytR-Cps2A-Psr (LCP) family protein